MAKKPFMARAIDKRIDLSNTFVGALEDSSNGLAVKYALTAPEMAELGAGRDWANWIRVNTTGAHNSSSSVTQFRNRLFNGDGSTDSVPVPPTFTLSPATATPVVTLSTGVFPFLASIAVRIKKSVVFTAADGAQLGIIGAEETLPDPASTAPTISLRPASGGYTELVWKKGMFDAIRIEVDRGGGMWAFLAIDSEPNYIDTVKPAAGASATYKYRAIYILHDAEYGQWSETAQITVGGG